MTIEPTTPTPSSVTPPGVDPTTVTVTPPVSTSVTPAEPTTTPSLDDLQAQVKRMEAALKEANNQAKEHRLKAKELDELKAKLEADKLTEAEKLQKQLADLQAKHDAAVQRERQSAISAEIRLQASTAGVPANRLDRVSRLIDASEITFEDGKPTNVKDLMDALLKDVPELVGKAAPSTSGGATNPPRSQSAAPTEISWDIIGRLVPGTNGQYKDSQTGAMYDPAQVSQWQNKNPRRGPRNY